MTSVFSAMALPKTGRFLRKPDFLKTRPTGDAGEVRKLFNADELVCTTEEVEPDLRDLNAALCALVDIFPDVQIDVFREMLLNLSDQSRLEVVTEHMLRNGAHFIQGRYRKAKDAREKAQHRHNPLPKHETFRSERYKSAVKAALYHEFKNLSHSSIRAVLAENNYSYSLARPTLHQLDSNSWRFALSNIFSRKRPALPDPETHPLIQWQADAVNPSLMHPYYNRTKSLEFDCELYETYVLPILARQRQELLDRDLAFAHQLNEAEAEEVGALFDCECCFTSTTFEQVSTCDAGGCHFICFRCIKFAANEALYGQGWARNIDMGKSSLRCLAPSVPECQGCINPQIVRIAMSTDKDGVLGWQKLQERVAFENLLKSQLPLLRCPFCPYAELDEHKGLRFRSPTTLAAYFQRLPLNFGKILGALFFLCVYPFIFLLLQIVLFISTISKPTYARLQTSRTRVARRRRGLKFTCQSISCGESSCTNCGIAWTDPHSCYEDSIQSLRQCIESATTSSVKRTCPKCNLSFVKSSGCNKLVCNCGYTMCYVCRQEIGREGYGHFCQHFREFGGRCSECDRCDLYIVEDEEGTIRRAAIEAEKEWLEKEGKNKDGGEGKFGAVVDDVLARTKGGRRFDYDGWLDTFMEIVLE